MKYGDKITKEQIVIQATGYSRKYKCDLVVFEKKCCLDFMLKQKAEKSGIKGIEIIYGEQEITITYEDKTTKKVKTDLSKKEKIRKKVVQKPVEKAKAEDKSQEVQDKE